MFFSHRKRNDQNSSVETEGLYPDLKELISLKDRKARLKLNAEQAIRSTVPGDHHSPFRGQGLEFDAVREYVPGDDVRNIDWRVTARTGAPHLKLFREERERQVLICVDMNAAMRFGTRKTFKSIQAARIAAFMGWRALDERDRVGACLFGDVPGGIQYFDPKRTRQSLWSMLKLMTEPPQEHHEVPLYQALQHVTRAVQTGALVYVISDFMDISEQVKDALMRLSKRCDVVCISVNDPAEAELPPVGSLELVGSNAAGVVVDTDNGKGRKEYAAQWKERCRRLHETMVRVKASMIELTTEMDIHRELLLGLRAIARRRRR